MNVYVCKRPHATEDNPRMGQRFIKKKCKVLNQKKQQAIFSLHFDQNI